MNFAAAAPTPLRRLANQLPGQANKNLGDLLVFNSFVPLVAPLQLNEAELPDLREIFGIRKACVPPATPDAPFEDY